MFKLNCREEKTDQQHALKVSGHLQNFADWRLPRQELWHVSNIIIGQGQYQYVSISVLGRCSLAADEHLSPSVWPLATCSKDGIYTHTHILLPYVDRHTDAYTTIEGMSAAVRVQRLQLQDNFWHILGSCANAALLTCVHPSGNIFDIFIDYIFSNRKGNNIISKKETLQHIYIYIYRLC